MHVKTFRAASLQEALQQVRQTLGPDASVLQTRELRHSRFGIFPQKLIEVDASADVSVASRFNLPLRAPASPPNSAAASQTPDSASDPTNSAPEAKLGTPQPSHMNPASHGATPNSTQPAGNRIGNVAPQLTQAMVEVLTEMLDGGVEPQLAKTLLDEACGRLSEPQKHERWSIQGRIHQMVASDLRTTGAIELAEDEQRVMAFVGPTGVGKTTTLAKIAAGFRYDFGSQIGLITLDTFRLGAVDQLLQYAELISAPLEVVSSPDQVTGALRRLRECDLVLLDTAGRSPKDTEQLAVLADCLHAAQPDSVQLVLSATSSRGHIRDAIQQFSSLNPTSLLVTKLDEAVAFGEWLSILREGSLPVSYLTAGQHVPQDIAVAAPRRLAAALLGQAQHPGTVHESKAG